MALNAFNSSNLEQLALKGLNEKAVVDFMFLISKLNSDAATGGVVQAQWVWDNPKNSRWGVQHPTILVYLVTFNWPLNCTAAVYLGHSIAVRNSRHRHSSCF